MLKRQLEREVPVPAEVDGYSFKQLVRVGGERGLVRNVEVWFVYRDKRNLTAHTYNLSTAEEVFSILSQFAQDAVELLRRLEARDGE